MLPTAITLWNYRSFATPVSFELRPITLLYGINNAGKSALLRALPILSESVGPEASGPLHLESPAAFETTFQDLRWKGVEDDEDPDLGLELWQKFPPGTNVTSDGRWQSRRRHRVVFG
jgi:AAA15 family ATPase/GTPase